MAIEERVEKIEKRLNHIETDIKWVKTILLAIVIPVWLLVVGGIIVFIFRVP